MPIYEYACENCGHHLEVMQRLSDEPITLCPNCKKESLIRLISAAGFRLKGGGWYETDFKDNAKKKNLVGDNESSSNSSKEGSQASSNATETKVNSSETSKNQSSKPISSSVNTDTTKKGSSGTSGASSNSSVT